MTSFDELGLDDALVEALSAEGIERPTAFQEAAIPVLRRGNNLVGHAGPGSGCLIAYAIALLDRVGTAEEEPTRVLVLTPTAEAAQRAAETVARLALGTGVSVAALGSPWVLPARATFLFAAPPDVLSAVRASELKLDGVQAAVVDGAGAMIALGNGPDLETILESVPPDAQRVLLAAPMSDEVLDLATRHARKAVHLPPRAAEPADGRGVRRGTLLYAVAGEDRHDALLALVDRHLQDQARHVLVFFSSEDRAADVGDFLALHGFGVGPPGDGTVPVWLAVDERTALDAQREVEEPAHVAVVSYDVPGDPDSMDRRHGIGAGTVLVRPRELPHLRQTASAAGYSLQPAPETGSEGRRDAIERLRSGIVEAVTSRDLSGELLTLEPLFERHAPAEVAAGLLALLRDGSSQTAPDPPSAREAPSWTRLFVSVGSRDGVGARDLVGAIAGEANVTGAQVGKIEIRETFSLVEVERDAAERVIRALNGTTLRGRSARVDFDRGSSRGGGARKARQGRGRPDQARKGRGERPDASSR